MPIPANPANINRNFKEFFSLTCHPSNVFAKNLFQGTKKSQGFISRRQSVVGGRQTIEQLLRRGLEAHHRPCKTEPDIPLISGTLYPSIIIKTMGVGGFVIALLLTSIILAPPTFGALTTGDLQGIKCTMKGKAMN